MSFTKQHKEAIEKRAGLSELLLSIPAEAAKREGTEAGKTPTFTPEEQERFDKVDADILAEDATIERLTRLAEEEKRGNERQALIAANKDDEPGDGAPAVDFNDSLKRWGAYEETKEDRHTLGVQKDNRTIVLEQPLTDHKLMERDRRTFSHERLDKAMRAQSVGTDSEGGYLRPEGFWNSLTESRLAYGGMRQARTFVFRTATGQTLPIPTVDDTSNVGAILSENAEDAEQDLTFAEIQLSAYKYTSKWVKVPFELMQDSAFDLAAFIGRALGVRLGRIENTHFTTGTGSAQPNGAVTAAASGKAAASASVITYPEILDLKHSVNPAYRNGAEFMFNDSILAAVKKLAIGSADARPLWAPGMAVGEPSTIDGDRYVINQDMASIAASAKIMLYGDFSQYWIRDVGSIRLKRADERWVEFDQTGFVALMRTDADLIDAGTDPLKYYIMAAS